MDFEPTPAQREIVTRVAAFASRRSNGRPGAEGEFPREAWRELGAFGVLGLSVPEAHGGLGLDTLGTALAIEALGRRCSDCGLVFSACAHLFACAMPIADHASEALKARVLPRLASGEAIGANAITEAEAGSDVYSLRARAIRDGDRYRLTGTKTYVTNAAIANVFVVYASTSPEDGHLGITA